MNERYTLLITIKPESFIFDHKSDLLLPVQTGLSLPAVESLFYFGRSDSIYVLSDDGSITRLSLSGLLAGKPTAR